MTRSGPLTIFAALATASSFSGAALADPYADNVSSIEIMASTVPGHSTDLDDGDMGRDSLGAPDYTGERWDTLTSLGYDTSTGAGGHIVLAFVDNRCIDGPGTDIKVYEGAFGQSAVGNETLMVEVSDDQGATFTPMGEVGPGTPSPNYEVDLGGLVTSVDRIRLTSTSFHGNPGLAGADLDAVECLNSVAHTGAYMDGCDLGGGDDGVDVKEVLVS